MLGAKDNTHAAAPYALFNSIIAYDGIVCQHQNLWKKEKGKRQKVKVSKAENRFYRFSDNESVGGLYSFLTFAFCLFTFTLSYAVFFSSS
jgi:hypothetical protein